MTRHDLVQQVRELLERHLDLPDIAARLHLDPEVVQNMVNAIASALNHVG
jgi:Mn-dependent DtxR family transcriptional regulator